MDPDHPLVELPDYIHADHTSPTRHVHSAFLLPLEDHGLPALFALLDILTDGELQRRYGLADSLLSRRRSEHAIRKVEIVGHGIGAAVGLLTSLALHGLFNDIPIETTLFGLPRVGDAAFADWVDSINGDRLTVNRITSFRDTIPHLPRKHFGLVHPSKGEIWIGSDPRQAYMCDGDKRDDASCGARIALGRTVLNDHQGPYGGVWIGTQSCQGRS